MRASGPVAFVLTTLALLVTSARLAASRDDQPVGCLPTAAGAQRVETFSSGPMPAAYMLSKPAFMQVGTAGAPMRAGEPRDDAEPGMKPVPVVSAQDIMKLKLMELRLDGPAEKLNVRFINRPKQRDLVEEVLAEVNKREDADPAWSRTLRDGDASEKLQAIVQATGVRHADRIEIVGDPEVFREFRKRVLPQIARDCARSGCHNGPNSQAFRFPTHSPQSDAYAYTVFVLLDEMRTAEGTLIDRGDPENSPLLQYMLPAKANKKQPGRDHDRAAEVENDDHRRKPGRDQPAPPGAEPPQSAPAERDKPPSAAGHPPLPKGRRMPAMLTGTKDPNYAVIVDWIASLRLPHPDYHLQYQVPVLHPAPASAPASAPAKP